jgi:O-antigen/teichoic acid export membrane protein
MRDEKKNQGLRMVAMHGVLWNVFLAAINKVVTTVGQIVLAWYLLPQDFGLVAIASSVIALATIFTASGIDDLLVQRHRSYEQDAPQIFWISLGFNIFALGVVFCLLPIAQYHFKDARVGLLMVIMAGSWPISTLPLIMIPKLRNTHRFRDIAVLNLFEGSVFTGSAVILAYLGAGPYALALPIFIRVLFSSIAVWWLLGGLKFQVPRPSTWLSYLAPGTMLMAGNFVAVMIIQFPNLIVGSLLDSRLTGLFSWGTLVASQAIFLLVMNLRGLFTPLFSKMHGQPERFSEAVARSLFVITALVVPICLLQAFFAGPLLETYFPKRWLEAAPVISIMSIGFMVQPVVLISQAALVAAANFGKVLLLSTIQLILVGMGVFCGGKCNQIIGAAFGYAGAMFLCLPFCLWVLSKGLAFNAGKFSRSLRSVIGSIAAFLPVIIFNFLNGGRFGLMSASAEVVLYGLSILAFYNYFEKKWISDVGSMTISEISRLFCFATSTDSKNA